MYNFVFPLRYVSVTTPAQLDLSAVSKLGPHVRCLYLAGVGIKRIPAEVFTRCPGLEWLDLRDNRLMEVAEEITAHPRLKVGPWCSSWTWDQLSASKRSIRRFVITKKAPTRAFSWLKAPTSAFTLKTLLRHYAKRTLTPR